MKRRSSKLKTSCIISIMWFYPSCIGNYIILYSECRLVFYQCKVKPVRFRWSRSTWGKKKECLLSPLLHVHLYWFFVPNNYSVTYTLYTWSSFVKKNAHVFHILTRVTLVHTCTKLRQSHTKIVGEKIVKNQINQHFMY